MYIRNIWQQNLQNRVFRLNRKNDCCVEKEVMKKGKIHIVTLGCPKNLVDSEIIKGGLLENNFAWTDNPEDADKIIINTCGFLDVAREESVDTILEMAELKRSGSLKELIVAGCMSQRYPDELKTELPEVDKFFGANAMKQILEYLSGKRFLAYDPVVWRQIMTPRHYAYLKIAEGCDNVCSFCAIPAMRGKQVSRTIDDILRETNLLQQRGVKELLVIAQDTTTYGWDLNPRFSLTDLLKELDRVDGIEWIRLHYTHPSHFGPTLLPFLKDANKVIPYLDMPVQHINSRMLKLMKRGLDGDGIRKLLSHVRTEIPDIILRTTLIVGFPGETRDEFEELLDFVKETRFDRLGVFTYSEEEGTSAADLKNDVPQEEKERRLAEIMGAQQVISLENNEALIGAEQIVLMDVYDQENDESIGRTFRDSPEIDNQIIVRGKLKTGEFHRIRITDAFEYDLIGEKL